MDPIDIRMIKDPENPMALIADILARHFCTQEIDCISEGPVIIATVDQVVVKMTVNEVSMKDEDES